VSASKSYAPHHEYIFSPRVFTELQNAQAIALPYDGLNPMRPQFCYLKPHYLDVQNQLLRPCRAGRAMSSLDRILPFLRPIEDLLLDPTVTEVMVNDGGRRVFVERDGNDRVGPVSNARDAESDGRDQEHRESLRGRDL
jgi:hypothetical protein